MAEGGGAESPTFGTLRPGRFRPTESPFATAAAKAARPYNKARRAHNSTNIRLLPGTYTNTAAPQRRW
jgi:hypothetical protein